MKFSLTSLFSLLSIGTIGVALSYDLAPEGSEMHDPDQCTAILVSAGAAADGVGSMTTHTNDCLDCDFRLAKVPAKDHAPGSMRKIIGGRAQYPRYIGDDRGSVYTKDKIIPGLYDWDTTEALGEIPEVEHTYAYLDGDYGIQNEHQLAMGESTCGALLHAVPTFDGGDSLLEMSELSRIAMERCKTARCANQLMGDLAVEYGFYGAVWKGDDMTVYGEAGEAMTINDKTESWMFHILSDDTGASAVWVAQRVPEGHIAAVANGFVIKEIDLDDTENFMGSSNIYDVAERAGLWTKGEHFSFAEVFGMNRGHLSTYVNRRVWRVFDLAAPSLKLPAKTDVWARDYPFSVPVDKGLTVADVAAMQRDYYEGTEFDTSKQPAGGPYGNPARVDQSPVDGMTKDELVEGRFERTISLFRTSYSFVTQSRSTKPDIVGALTWFGQFTPHATVYIPVYAHVSEVPESLSTGALQRLDRKANWWAFSAVGNYAAQWFSFTIGEIRTMQHKFEDEWFKNQDSVEELGLTIQGFGGNVAAVGYLTDWCNEQALDVRTQWWEFLDYLMGKYRDGMMMDKIHTETISPTKLFYPRWWLEMVGYWGFPGATYEDAEKANEGEHDYNLEWDEKPKHKKDQKEAEEAIESYHNKPPPNTETLGAASPVPVGTSASLGPIILAGLVGAVFGVFGKVYADKKAYAGYATIPV
jgi:dipeptidase